MVTGQILSGKALERRHSTAGVDQCRGRKVARNGRYAAPVYRLGVPPRIVTILLTIQANPELDHFSLWQIVAIRNLV